MTSIDTVFSGDRPIVRLAFDANEASILSEIADQFVRLVTDAPDDPAASGLFPDGYTDPAAQAEFSRFTRSELSGQKIAAAELVRDTLRAPASADGVVVEFDAEGAWRWLTFFTDIRMVLAERMRERSGEAEFGLQQGLYDWTAYLQGAIVDELSAQLPGDDSL